MNQAATQFVQPERGLITVAHITPAPGPGKSARIKDTDGMMFGVWPDKLNGVVPGGTYEIEFIAKVSNGVTYRDIKAIRVSDRPGPAPDQFTAGRPQQVAAQAKPSAAQPNGNGQYYRPTAPRDSERMFVCSTLNAFIQTGRVDCHREVLAAAINELRAAYAATFGAEDQ